MRSLYFLEMMILSKTEKAAATVAFSKTRNLIVGENDVGKSTLVKSLYHCLGADTPVLNNNRWKKANPIYSLRFEIDGTEFTIVRDERFFGLFDQNRQLVGRYQGIGSRKGVGTKINQLLGFNVSLENKDGKIVALTPSFYFLPFYVDQDKGWSNSWSSFDGLTAVKSYRTAMVDYHLGIRSQAYYDANAALKEIGAKFKELSEEKNALIGVRDRYRARKDKQHFDLDPETFRKEVEELVCQLNEVSERRQIQLDKIKHVRNDLLSIQTEIEILESAVRELESDYHYVEKPDTPDHIDCPTCGTEFTNSIVERFGLLDDIDYCRSLIDQKQKKLMSVANDLGELEDTYNKLSKEEESVNVLLTRKKENISVREFILSEGYKDVLGSISHDITELDRKQSELENDQKSLKSKTVLDRELKTSVTSFYKSKMKESLNSLNVQVLREEDYSAPDRLVTSNALGSDAPRSLLAQYLSLLHTMKEFNSFVRCPLVIDSPFQQEQDETNKSAILKFITNQVLADEQLILATLKEHTPKLDPNHDFRIIEFEHEYALLQRDHYEQVYASVAPLHELTLKVD